MTEQLGTLLVYLGLVILGMVATVVLSWLLGERHRASWRDVPYESGVLPAGDARLRFGAHFYLVGVFFLLFDVEAAILFAWAVAFWDLGWTGFWGATSFVITLALGLVYVWREGGLSWSARARLAEPPAEEGR
ncbi:MAG: NADH-quinone oxidoreductase subunit A [Myxococcota bacterium]|jgi:NADH-quinone oxidoreductase subunit A|nr:NADH-quinone oxidoreductase subunit A [Myxococcota bacterium]